MFRLLYTALILAQKYNEDIIYINKCYAKLAEVNLSKMNEMETIFSELIDYKFYVTSKVYEEYVSLLYSLLKKKNKAL